MVPAIPLRILGPGVLAPIVIRFAVVLAGVVVPAIVLRIVGP